ncbi:UDP-glucose 4-epimerase GalE [Streptomyces uncialis]|uniref:UDP-glucose 4-epimerase n=1 Tax=Streptomyces uncialis TaxID=1048205 RepID=A0A1Q4V0B9_9ACTN|nr:UDP-glucose 4-epimerase GalE [Streptomyces uncialis]OKH91278.1 UDP-glucose 4-epimerase [Streptomyces uncialis]WTE11198.1 UDP-glucose 4-epimerase GalE [Streptomyces uncialis]
MTWLITGGAGYIGAHVVRAMRAAGERTVVYDDLSTGDADRVPDGVPLVVGSTLDPKLVARALSGHEITGVVHLAGRKRVDESVELPLRYYHENVEGLRVLLDAVTAAGVSSFVFSSSAAVYGAPDTRLVTEDTPCVPVNPYGETKLVGEWLVRAAGRAHGLSTASLRYFNVAGAASPELADSGKFNLVPMVLERLTANRPPRIFGTDHATPDGTCVRDYIHVADLAEAHVAAARHLRERGPGAELTLNIGRGEGVSVREMISEITAATGSRLPPEVAPRRAGDPARVVACADRAARVLGWKPQRDVRDMVTSAWLGWQRAQSRPAPRR